MMRSGCKPEATTGRNRRGSGTAGGRSQSEVEWRCSIVSYRLISNCLCPVLGCLGLVIYRIGAHKAAAVG